jgi:hypothetical protein
MGPGQDDDEARLEQNAMTTETKPAPAAVLLTPGAGHGLPGSAGAPEGAIGVKLHPAPGLFGAYSVD